MKSSGMKRGLAISAVSALALTGLAFTSAQAQTVAEGQGANTLVLYSQSTNGISTAGDGENTTVTLFAASSPLNAGVAVNAFRFQHLDDDDGGVWKTIGTVNATDPTEVSGGIGILQWANPPGNANQVNDVRVQSLDINGNVLLTDNSGNIINEVDNNTNESISLAGANRDEVGVFEGNVIISGKTTDIGDADVQVVGPSATGSNSQVDQTGPSVAGLFPWAEVISVGAGNLPDASNEIIVRADVNDGDPDTSDDVQAYTTYVQVPTNVTVTADPDNDNPQLPGDQVSDYFITVTDQKGAPVAGVDLSESVPDGSAPFFGAVGFPNSGTTDELGRVEVSLDEFTMDFPAVDQDPAAGVQATYYFVDLNNNGTFQNGVDKVVKVSQSNVPQAPASVEIVSSLGNVMDADERTDLKFTVKDAGGNPLPNVALTGSIDRDVADGSPADSSTPLPALVTNGAGTVTLGGQQLGINDNEVDVTVKATAGAANGTLAVETDEAVTTWDEYPTAQALATTDTTQGGVVELPSGSVLPNRTVGITLIPTGNALFSPQAEQPAGTTRGGDLIASAVTNAQGRYSVKIDDPALPNGQELDDIVRGSANDAGTGFNINPGDCPPPIFGLPNCLDLDLDWLRTITPTRIEIHNAVNGTTADGLDPGLGGALQPGGLGIGEVVAFNADDVELEDVNVTLTIDEGNFVKIDDAFDTPAIGAPIDFKSAGKTLVVNTGEVVGSPGVGNAKGAFLANIERNAGFDDDGLVRDHITATAGAVSDEHDMTWSTNNVPINPRATNPLEVDLSADQDSSILPKARAGDTIFNLLPGSGSGQLVNYDVKTFDQFGNPTSQNTDAVDNTPLAGFADSGTSEFGLNQPAIQAWADTATNQSIEVELEGSNKIVYQSDPGDSSFDISTPLAFLQAIPVVVEDNTATVNWYNLNLSASTFSLGQQGPNTVPVGTTVTEVFTAVDQEGQYIEGLLVDFLRAGPGPEDDDSCAEDVLNACQRTNSNGKAFHDFAGGRAGAANVSVVVYEDDGTRFGNVAQDTVRFGGTKTQISPKLIGKNNGAAADKLKVKAGAKADGATVQLYKLKNGKRTLIQTKKTNAVGVVNFTVPDLNGGSKTKYFAVVRPTGDTFRGQTPAKSIR